MKERISFLELEKGNLEQHLEVKTNLVEDRDSQLEAVRSEKEQWMGECKRLEGRLQATQEHATELTSIKEMLQESESLPGFLACPDHIVEPEDSVMDIASESDIQDVLPGAVRFTSPSRASVPLYSGPYPDANPSFPPGSNRASGPLPKIPTPKSWSNSKEDDPVAIFLPRVKAYLDYHGTFEPDMVSHAQHFLTGKAFQLWSLHAEQLRNQHLPATWEVFPRFLLESFGAIAPERQARFQYDNLQQTGAVFSYIAEQRKLVHLMKHNPAICPGEPDIIRQFIRNAKQDLKMYLVDKTPDMGYYSTCEEVYSKAIIYSTNQRARAEAQPAPKKLMTINVKPSHKPKGRIGNQGSQVKARFPRADNSSSAGLAEQQPVAKRPKPDLIPDFKDHEEQWLRAGRCALCGSDGHGYKKCARLQGRMRKDHPRASFA